VQREKFQVPNTLIEFLREEGDDVQMQSNRKAVCPGFHALTDLIAAIEKPVIAAIHGEDTSFRWRVTFAFFPFFYLLREGLQNLTDTRSLWWLPVQLKSFHTKWSQFATDKLFAQRLISWSNRSTTFDLRMSVIVPESDRLARPARRGKRVSILEHIRPSEPKFNASHSKASQVLLQCLG